MMLPKPDENLIQVKNLKKYFPTSRGFFRRTASRVKAVDDISFSIRKWETFGLVGESGCGKTTCGRAILRLIEPTSGEILYEGAPMHTMSQRSLQTLRREIQLIFQDPLSSLNPRISVGKIIEEGLWVHGMGNRSEREEKVRETLLRVGLSPEQARLYPHELSGGQRQRIVIARALVLNPKFIVCDEPISALDVSIQSQIINLLVDLKLKMDISYLFITHDLSVVRYISDRIAVMYCGKIVELAEADELFENPLHPYTQMLLVATPSADPREKRKTRVVIGDVPSSLNLPSGCRFHPRCALAVAKCKQEEPQLMNKNGHLIYCHKAA